MNIHFIGIGGSAMGSVAVACSAAGHTVTGSDIAIYPPMSTVLAEAGVSWYDGYDAHRMMRGLPDLIVVGNAISRGNAELEYTLSERLNMTSMAGLVGTLFIDTNMSIVVSGTHGKTTTASITAWLLESANRRPGFLIGGVPGNADVGCRPVPSELHDQKTGVFVSEGDEYDTAFFDKRSKFVHYRPTIAIINNIEFDHADIFPDLSAILRSFEQLVRIVPANGAVIVNANDANALATVRSSYAPVESCGTTPDAFWRIGDLEYGATSSTWTMYRQGALYGTFTTSMPGEHSVRNCAMAIASTAHAGLTPEQQQQGLATFLLPKRRLEEIARWKGCVVIDDFAHHPTAIAATLTALKQKYPTSRVIAVFEPRSNTTTRAFFQRELAECFVGASAVCIGPVNRPERYAIEERLDTVRLVQEIEAHNIQALSIPADRASDPMWGADVMLFLESNAMPGDVIAILSNGNVGGLRQLLSDQS
ncbi:UDP-N-acetylmuramate:L-alanyl-gamma-D-glutamyl-meso-diaminopimelate ligase [soil metagenome]